MPAIPQAISTLVFNAPPPVPVKQNTSSTSSTSASSTSAPAKSATESESESETPFADSLAQASTLLEKVPGFPVPGLTLDPLFIPPVPVPDGDANLANFLPLLMAQFSQTKNTSSVLSETNFIAPSEHAAEGIQSPLLTAMFESATVSADVVSTGAGFADALSKAAISAASQGSPELQGTISTPLPPAPLSGTSTTPVVDIAPPVGTREWGNDIGNRLVWMVNRQESRAELVLNPPQLGRIEISLTVSGSEANAQFSCASPAVKEALENALPRLRELLADAGITLGQAQVGSHSSGRQGQEKGDNSPQGFATLPDNQTGTQPLALMGSLLTGQSSGRGLIDIFA